MPDTHPNASRRDRQEEPRRSKEPAATPDADPSGLRRGFGAGILAIAGLSSLAFAQPVYDLLRRAPEFFAIRDLSLGDLLALVLLLAIGPTLALAAPAAVFRCLHPSWMRHAIAAPVGLLTAVVALQAIRGLPAAVATMLALAAGAAVATAYIRFPAVRSFATLLSAAAVLVPALLVFDGQVRRSAASPSQAIKADLGDTGARAPVVLVIFDEWSVTSILDAEGVIDRERLPNLARLADRATWFPNATAAADISELAVPAMLTGQRAEQGRLPTLAEQPVNLFTMLAASHDIYAIEPITSLCPPEVNLLAEQRAVFSERFGLLLSDLAVVWLHLTVPEVWTEQLPEITHGWSGFGLDAASEAMADPTDSAARRALRHLRDADRAAEFRFFGDSVRPPGRRPGFYFLHTLLPHRPWEYLASGRTYRSTQNRTHGLQREMWTTEPWPVRHHQKRYLLQVQFIDLLIGELIDKLEALDLFDQSVIAITADHGVAFAPGQSRRVLDTSDPAGYQPMDLAAVPLIIKAPFQEQAIIDDTATSLASLTPRILELAGADPDSIPEFRDTGTPSLVGKYVVNLQLPIDREPWRQARLTEQTTMLGEENDPMAIGAVPGLHGRTISELPQQGSEIGIRLVSPDLWDDVDPAGAALPAIVHGILTGPESLLERSVAVALNGVVAASVRPHQTNSGEIRIAAMLPERLFQPGPNQLDVFLVSYTGDVVTLEHVNRPRRFVYELTRDDEGRAELLRRPRSGFDSDVERIPVGLDQTKSIGFLEGGHRSNGGFGGWAVDLADPGGIEEVVAFLGGNQVWTGRTTSERQSVANRYGPDHLYSAFSRKLGPGEEPDAQGLETIRRQGFEVFAVSRRGVAGRLRFLHAPIEEEGGEEVLPISDGRRLPVLAHGGRFDGSVDLITRTGKSTSIEGWAGDLEDGEPPRRIVVYRDGKYLAALNATNKRLDVAEHYDDQRLLRTGFRGRVPGGPDPATFAERHRVFALMSDGSAVELPIETAPGTEG